MRRRPPRREPGRPFCGRFYLSFCGEIVYDRSRNRGSGRTVQKCPSGRSQTVERCVMETANLHNKLILAVVQEDDYDATVSELNQNGFFVTMLSSTGGFWKKKNITIMLGCRGGAAERRPGYFKAVRRKAEADGLLQCCHAGCGPVCGGHALHPHEYGVRRRDPVRSGPGAAGKVLIPQVFQNSGDRSDRRPPEFSISGGGTAAVPVPSLQKLDRNFGKSMGKEGDRVL